MTRSRHEWLGLIEVSGPFLAAPVLDDVFPQGLDALEQGKPQRLRATYEEWRDAVDVDDPDLKALHAAWIDEVLATALELDPQVVRIGSAVPAAISATLPEHGVTFGPDIAVVEPGSDALLLAIHVFAPDVDLDATRGFDGWATTPKDRMVALLRAIGCALGLVTNGERWLLVHVPADGVTGFASWYARLWAQEPDTLRAFASLLGIRRFFGHSDAKLTKLYERSLTHQDKVTDALGDQVCQAVEVLVQALDRANQDRNGELLRDVEPRTLYEAGLTVMMRLVFLLAAEERGLLLLGEERYDRFYALSTLRMQLRADSEEILERRRSAWSRLLALFRAVYGGIEHPILRLPALGGSLFDPDRYVFLEGRATDTSWRTDSAEPLPIDDRTVLLLLEAIQTFEGRTLSYRALDVEQIGHVYEGLLERTVVRVDDVTLELEASVGARTPRVGLGELESARLVGQAKVVALIKERSGRSELAIRNGIGRPVSDGVVARLLTVCRGDVVLRDRILPYASLLRSDPWDYPLVLHPGSFVVALGSDRRDSGTHYTPKSLTDRIVRATLTPLAYEGPSEGKPEAEWRLKTPEQLLDLKICDPAMGSGAFLVAVCRWLSERLVEAWSNHEATAGYVDDQVSTDQSSAHLSNSLEERAIIARQLIAEKCIYGVDQNPIAVELAKLSLWLTTLSKFRPFGFLDHNLRFGDSIFGITDIKQLLTLSDDPRNQIQHTLFGKTIEACVERAIAGRSNLRLIAVRDIKDVEAISALDRQSRIDIALPTIIANAICGIALKEANKSNYIQRMGHLAIQADSATIGDPATINRLILSSDSDLTTDMNSNSGRKPFHWPLEFPEVFSRDRPGFDAVVGNPPFLGGRKISSTFGSRYERAIKEFGLNGTKGTLNLVIYFFLRASAICRKSGAFGMLSTDSITENETRDIGLTRLFEQATPIHAQSSFPWPGAAGVRVAIICCWVSDSWSGERLLDGRRVSAITTMLTEGAEIERPDKLPCNKGVCSDGVKVQGIGFVIGHAEAQSLISANPENSEVVVRYIVGDDINSALDQKGDRWVVNFWDRNESEARMYEACWRLLEERVKPYRSKLTKQVHEACFWKFWDRREAFFNRVRQLDRHLVCCKLSKHLAFAFGDTTDIYSEKAKVFDIDSYSAFGVLQSSLHLWWALQWGSTTGVTPSYVGSSCFDTFPFPASLRAGGVLNGSLETDGLKTAAENYYSLRRRIVAEDNISFTKIYNAVHNKDYRQNKIDDFRGAVVALDTAVAREYGWTDLNLNHDFEETRHGIRFLPNEIARAEIVRRLLVLNKQIIRLSATEIPNAARPNSRRGAHDRQMDLALDRSCDG
ncbi:DNA methyltransferase [Methylobacterium sp. Leaf123]|uniref:Eco57I restriction-modification methylase domain-containing protein n=1 Tax=Methylobacterium sp. Leaf123 TaxID=1736264 RepID=UPI000B1305F5|nr:DNA methyltransferase [Methylobacterium sp. Leaf123]